MRNIYLTFGISTAVLMLLQLIPGQTFLHPQILLVNAFMVALSVFAHRLIWIGKLHFPHAVPMVFLTGTFFRMLFSLAVFGIYVAVNQQSRHNGLVLGLEFFLLYLLYAVVEIKSFLATLRLGFKNQSKI